MTNITTQLAGFFETLEPIFENINQDNLDQSTGAIMKHNTTKFELNPGFKCCVGAHVAFALRKPMWPEFTIKNVEELSFYYDSLCLNDIAFYFEQGEGAILDLLKEVYPKIHRYMMYALFHCAGAPLYPFSAKSWKILPIEVLERMECIETMPPNIKANNLFDYYDCVEVSNWIKRERDNIMKKYGYIMF